MILVERWKLFRNPELHLPAALERFAAKYSAAWLLPALLYFTLRFYLAATRRPYLLDDAYITLRYVENALQLGVLEYNPGERVFGITTILYPFLLIPLHALFPFAGLAALVMILNTFLEFACFLALLHIFKQQGVQRAAAIGIALLVVSNGIFLSASHGGMETPLFCLLLLLAAALAVNHIGAAACCAGLALFTRPEGLLLMGVLFVLNLMHPRGKTAFIAPILAGLLYMAFFYFGYHSFIPASVEAKRSFPQHAFFSAGSYMFQGMRAFIPLATLPIALRLLVICPIAVYGALKWPKKTPGFALLVAFPLLLWLLYALANPHMWFWYSVPFTVCASVFFFYGLFRIAGVCAHKKRHLAVTAVAVLIALNLRWAFLADGALLARYTSRVAEYHKVVETLEQDHGLTPKLSILTHEIGAIGYYSRATLHDAVGLTNPELAPLGLVEEEGRLKHGRCTVRNVARCQADFLLFQDGFFEAGLLESDAFQAQYKFLFEAEGTAIPGLTGNLLIFKNVAAAPESFRNAKTPFEQAGDGIP